MRPKRRPYLISESEDDHSWFERNFVAWGRSEDESSQVLAVAGHLHRPRWRGPDQAVMWRSESVTGSRSLASTVR